MLESLKQQIITADNIAIIILIIVLMLTCAASLYGIFRFFHRSRIIDDTPTSKIRSAHQGFIELEGIGRLMKGTPIISPLSKQQCLWYKYKIEHKTSLNSKNNWETVDSGISDNLFLITDDTGICVVDPEGAVITPSFAKTWYGSKQYHISDSGGFNGVLNIAGVSTGSNNYRYTEKRIDVGEQLYVLGRFKSIGGRREKVDKKGEVRELLSKWKKTPNFLLARFDENGDGEIDLVEWQEVIKAAEQEVDNSFSERLLEPEIHTMSKPVDNRRPYIISVEGQETISKKYRWYSRGSIIGFFLSGMALAWVIGLRLASLS